MNNLLTTTFLAGISVIMLIGVTPAFADSTGGISQADLDAVEPAVRAEVHNPQTIYYEGFPGLVTGNEMTMWVQANDFVLGPDNVLNDVHFWTLECLTEGNAWDGTLDFWVFEDLGGIPGNIIASGAGQSVQKMPTGFAGLLEFVNCNDEIPIEFEYWMDLPTPLELDSGVTYWIGLHLSSNFDRDQIYWQDNAFEISLPAAESFLGTFNNWVVPGVESVSHAFYLTGYSPVGGEQLSLDTTALFVSGVGANAAWLLPFIAGIAGTGLYLAKFRTSKIEEY